jgi:acetyl-CoA carboxylase carboxyltransferase component
MAGYGSVMSCVSQASGVIPQIAVIPGVCAGSAAVIASMFDFIVITDKTGSVSVNAPFVLGDSSIGHAAYASESGLAALCAKDDASAMAAAAGLVDLLPSNNAEGTVEDITSCEINAHVDISEYLEGGSVDSLIKAVADEGAFTELYEAYAPEMCVGFAPVGGIVVGIIANRRSVNGGIITAAAARKAARMVSFCDAFNIPVVTVADSDGLDVSKEAEASPYAAELGKLAGAYSSCRSPMITVIAGEAYGAAFTVMGSKSLGADVVLALDSAKTGVMNAATAVAFLWNDQISAEISREELEAKWNETAASPVFAASAGEIDDIIDSAELRQRIGGAVMMLLSKSKAAPAKRHSNMPL